MSKRPPNPAHILLEKHMAELGVDYVKEYRFDSERRWRFDYVVAINGEPDTHQALAIEIEGAIWSRGRHTRGKGFQGDLEKYNHATMLGYRVLRFSTEDVMQGRAKAFLQEHLQ